MWKVFTVKEVRVQGNKLYSAEQIQELVLNDEYSWNSLYVVGKYNFKEPKPIPFLNTHRGTVAGRSAYRFNISL